MSTCAALLPISEEHIKRGIRLRFNCKNKTEIAVRVEQDNINAFGSIIQHVCLEHIPKITIKKIIDKE